MQKYKRHELLRQAGRPEDANEVVTQEATALNAETARGEQRAKADAKKAKKQRQKAKKQQQLLNQTQSQDGALTPHSVESESHASPALSPEPESSARGSSEPLSETPALVGGGQSSAAEEDGVGVQGEEESRDSTDADMLQIFRCPICKVSEMGYINCSASWLGSL